MTSLDDLPPEVLHRICEMIEQHAIDRNKKPLLRRFHVRLISKYGFKEHLYPDMASGLKQSRFEEYMFNLERFVEEPMHVPIVEFTEVPGWFAQCLAMRVRGEGGDLDTLKWPTRTLNRKKGRFMEPWQQSRRRDSQAKLDWMSFARRNGIDMLEDASRFFPLKDDEDTD
ncbi:hypothetical protein E8E11_010219 [Didymella keratinophila]|nr:hypothetical protein E8E11_010219 [Didymella keratinophila]